MMILAFMYLITNCIFEMCYSFPTLPCAAHSSAVYVTLDTRDYCFFFQPFNTLHIILSACNVYTILTLFCLHVSTAWTCFFFTENSLADKPNVQRAFRQLSVPHLEAALKMFSVWF